MFVNEMWILMIITVVLISLKFQLRSSKQLGNAQLTRYLMEYAYNSWAISAQSLMQATRSSASNYILSVNKRPT